MKRNKWLLLLIVFMLLVSSACAKDEKNIILTTTQTTTEALTSRKSDNQTRAEPYPTVKIPTSPDDPYAQIIKDMYEEYAQSAEAERILAKRKYALYDLDKDGNNELLLNARCFRWGSNDEFSTLEPEEIYIFDRFYSIFNGEAIEVQPVNGHWYGSAGPDGGRDVLTNGIIRLYGGTPDYVSYAYFRYANGELEFLYSLRNYEDTGRWLVTYEGIQGTSKKITEEEFNRLRAEIEGDAQVVEIDWKPLESYGRD